MPHFRVLNQACLSGGNISQKIEVQPSHCVLVGLTTAHSSTVGELTTATTMHGQ